MFTGWEPLLVGLLVSVLHFVVRIRNWGGGVGHGGGGDGRPPIATPRLDRVLWALLLVEGNEPYAAIIGSFSGLQAAARVRKAPPTRRSNSIALACLLQLLNYLHTILPSPSPHPDGRTQFIQVPTTPSRSPFPVAVLAARRIAFRVVKANALILPANTDE